jgi:cell filamentation protein
MAIASWASFLYPNSSVLINKAGIKDQAKLDAFERGVTAMRLDELKNNPVSGDYGNAHMQAIHAHIFQDVYDWAGQYRTVNIAKGPVGDTTRFTPVPELHRNGDGIQKAIKDSNYLRGMDRDEFATKMGELYKQVNDHHPFREGNGRSARAYLEQLAGEAGYNLNYQGVSRQEWNGAAKESARGNLAPIQSVFKEISIPQRAVAFDRLHTVDAVSKHPELDGAYKVLYAAQKDGKDAALVREDISRQLHRGKIIEGGVSNGESLKVIELAAQSRGLTTDTPGSLGTKHAGTVVAQSSHHMLLKVDDKTAILFEKKTLDKDMNLKVGDKLTLQHQPLTQDRSRNVSESKGFERIPTAHRGG